MKYVNFSFDTIKMSPDTCIEPELMTDNFDYIEYDKDVVQIFQLCFGRVIPFYNDTYIVEYEASKYRLIDRDGKVLINRVNIHELYKVGKLLFSKEYGSMRLITPDTIELTSTDELMNIEELYQFDFGYYRYNLGHRYGILSDTGDIVTPPIYLFMDDQYSVDYTGCVQITVGYAAGKLQDTTYFKLSIDTFKKKAKYLAVVPLSETDGDKYQIMVTGFDSKKCFKRESLFRIWSYSTNGIENDREVFGFKSKPSYFGMPVGDVEYDNIIYDREISKANLFMVCNYPENSSIVDRKAQAGIIDKSGKIVVELKYKDIRFMGNNIFFCEDNESNKYIVWGNKLRQITDCKTYICVMPIPIVSLVFEDGKIRFMADDMSFTENLFSCLTIDRYLLDDGIHRINLYGTIYITDNNFYPIDKQIVDNIDIQNDNLWDRVVVEI